MGSTRICWNVKLYAGIFKEYVGHLGNMWEHVGIGQHMQEYT